MISRGAVSWSSKRQGCVAMSSCEAEYMAGSHAAKEAVWQRNFVIELGFDVHVAVSIYIDSESAIELMKNPKFHSRTKHIHIHTHFVRELIEKSFIKFIYCPTNKQVADSLTKSVPKDKTIFCRSNMGVVELQE